ncbi:MAG: sulfotransferase [Betaproteobacteria bacterium]|nr:sulfotransferase [Betaproteobacteria bacterium]
MDNVESTANPLASGTSVTDALMVSSIKEPPREMHEELHFVTHGDSVCLVHYEDMVLEPQQTFHRICQHLGIDSTPESINQMLVKASETSSDRQTD